MSTYQWAKLGLKRSWTQSNISTQGIGTWQTDQVNEYRSFELRLKTAWAVSQGADDDGPEQQPKWVLCSIFPEISEEGKILEIIGCITEISSVI